MGSANNMRYMIKVTASTPYRYANLTIMALPENAIAPRDASSKPRRLAAEEPWGDVFMRLVFYGVARLGTRASEPQIAATGGRLVIAARSEGGVSIVCEVAQPQAVAASA